MKLKRAIALIILFLTFSSPVYTEAPPVNAAAEIDEKRIYPALLGGLSVNAAYNLVARMFRLDFAETSWNSIYTNLTSPWVWDNDSFLFNHPGHPYQGGLYHNAARANGFSFYESLLFNTAGSVTWELFGETDIPSLNDLFITVYGGLALGEILHRLYFEWDSPLAFLVSPMDGIYDAIYKRHPKPTHNLYFLSTMTGAAWIASNKSPGAQQFSNYIGEVIEKELFTINAGFEIIYGNPYVQSSKIPFEHFEMKFLFGGGLLFNPFQPWLDWTMLIDGYLFSFNPIDTEKASLSNGLSLHYDLITGSNTNFAANSLAYSLKWRYDFAKIQLSVKFHLGAILFGSSRFYPDSEISNSAFYLGDDNNNYGIGGNAKLSFSISNRKTWNLNISIFPNFLYISPKSQSLDGWEIFNLSQLDYWHKLTEHFAIGISSSAYTKSGRYTDNNNINEVANRIMIYAKWIFIEKDIGLVR